MCPNNGVISCHLCFSDSDENLYGGYPYSCNGASFDFRYSNCNNVMGKDPGLDSKPSEYEVTAKSAVSDVPELKYGCPHIQTQISPARNRGIRHNSLDKECRQPVVHNSPRFAQQLSDAKLRWFSNTVFLVGSLKSMPLLTVSCVALGSFS